MKDYHATLKIQQGRLKSAMIEAGIKNTAELARRSGATLSAICELINFKTSPLRKDGTWRRRVLDICKVLAHEPSDIFPDHLHHEIATNKIEAFVEREQLMSSQKQLSPADNMNKEDVNAVVEEVLSLLTPADKALAKDRFWNGKTLEAIAKEQGVTQEYIRLKERRLLMRLRHPVRLNRLSEIKDTVFADTTGETE